MRRYLPWWTDPVRLVTMYPVLHRIAHRNRDGSCFVCAYVWRRLMSEPGFAESLEQGRADVEAGRTVRYTVDELRAEMEEMEP